MEYYDAILGLIPATIILGTTLTTTLTQIPIQTTVTIGGCLAILLVGHALFVNGPVDVPPTNTPRTDTRTETHTTEQPLHPPNNS